MGFFHYFFTHQKVSIMTRSIFHNNNSGQQCKENTGGQRRSKAGRSHQGHVEYSV